MSVTASHTMSALMTAPAPVEYGIFVRPHTRLRLRAALLVMRGGLGGQNGGAAMRPDPLDTLEANGEVEHRS